MSEIISLMEICNVFKREKMFWENLRIFMDCNFSETSFWGYIFEYLVGQI